MTQDRPDLSLIIASYSTSALTQACVESIIAHTSGITYEIVVVDDASTDDTVEQLRRGFPGIRVLVNDVNLHYAKTNNRGLSECNGRYACLLNSDTLLRNNAFKILVDYLDAHPGVGAGGPKLVNPDGSVQYCIRSFPSVAVMVLQAMNLQKIWPGNPITERYYNLKLNYNDTHIVESLGTTAFVLRREIWETVGMLDERFKIAFVDIAFCAKLRRANVEIAYVGSAVIEHLGSQSINLNSGKEVAERADGLRLLYDSYISDRHAPAKRWFVRRGIVAWGILRRMEHLLSKDKRVITGPGAPTRTN